MVKEVKQASNNAIEFSKHLAGVVVALSLVGLGVFSAWDGRYKTKLTLCAVALLFAGVINVIVGCVVLYRVLMHKEK